MKLIFSSLVMIIILTGCTYKYISAADVREAFQKSCAEVCVDVLQFTKPYSKAPKFLQDEWEVLCYQKCRDKF